jgi:hypothetical protein
MFLVNVIGVVRTTTIPLFGRRASWLAIKPFWMEQESMIRVYKETLAAAAGAKGDHYKPNRFHSIPFPWQHFRFGSCCSRRPSAHGPDINVALAIFHGPNALVVVLDALFPLDDKWRGSITPAFFSH